MAGKGRVRGRRKGRGGGEGGRGEGGEERGGGEEREELREQNKNCYCVLLQIAFCRVDYDNSFHC